ncbi:lipopolysaccharide biosynthesis protein [Nitratireductor basaltis]|uniref:lipopolysaccharide biosynthesis protein n=1 Tax=Nitratireductor basaltis TaxID=472175 RepID=UPI003CC78A00
MAQKAHLLRDYFKAISGSAGRLVFSLAYFVLLANALSIAEFGLFATASAAGVVLSRILGFGFIAPLYRIATVKPRLLGAYTAGFMGLSALSLPVLAGAAWLMYLLFFASDMPLGIFAAIVASEALLWRPTEAVIIVNNGLNRFGRGAFLTIMGTAIRCAAAFVFVFASERNLANWAVYYLAANGLSLLIAAGFFYPWRRLKFTPELYGRRLPDALYVSAAEILFYLQMELDKLLVLALGNPQLAGIYAIIMRLVDLTAIPIRTFSMLLVQKMMRMPDLLKRLTVRFGIEGAIFAVSTMGLLGLAIILHFHPRLLGDNVAEAAPLVMLALAIPGLRNLVEYQAELLFARGQTAWRAINLVLIGALKAGALALILSLHEAPREIVLSLNWAFLALYLLSLALTSIALTHPAKRV